MPRPLWKGPGWALIILLLWMASLAVMGRSLGAMRPEAIAGLIAVRAFLHTGLFVVAHDAMHGSLFPGRWRWNRTVGQIFLGLYGLIDYDHCAQNHGKHHRFPGQDRDPDFHAPGDRPLLWYFRFIRAYYSLGQFLVLLGIWLLILVTLQSCGVGSVPHFLLFWVLPQVISAVQLFLFGTYLPHRRTGSSVPGSIQSLAYPPWLSFLACYHFGYHGAHHRFPTVPWFDLPRIQGANQESACQSGQTKLASQPRGWMAQINRLRVTGVEP